MNGVLALPSEDPARHRSLTLAVSFFYLVGHSARQQATASTAEDPSISRADAARKLAEQTQAAADAGVSLSLYQRADSQEVDAWSACRTAVLAMAQWDGARAHWIPAYSWNVTQDGLIHIAGHDISMKNGFGAGTTISYDCSYDMGSKQAMVTSAE